MTRTIPQRTVAKVLYDCGISRPASIQRMSGIPERTARLYIKDFNEGKDHERKKYKTRTKPAQTPENVRKVIAKARNRKKIRSLKDIGRETGVSSETARRILKKKSFRYSGYKKRLVIPEESKKARLALAEKMITRESDWGYVVFTDECSFWLNRSKPNKLWTEDAMEEEGRQSHGPKVHVWGAITSRGAISLEIFEENLNSSRYLAILKKKRKELRKKLPEGFIFQQDGSPVHTAQICLEYIEEKFPQSLIKPEWPSYSPDLSPIENVWAWLKNQVNKDMPKTVSALKKSIKKHWELVNEEFLSPYYNSMQNRMEALIEKDGDKINY